MMELKASVIQNLEDSLLVKAALTIPPKPIVPSSINQPYDDLTSAKLRMRGIDPRKAFEAQQANEENGGKGINPASPTGGQRGRPAGSTGGATMVNNAQVTTTAPLSNGVGAGATAGQTGIANAGMTGEPSVVAEYAQAKMGS